MKKNKVVSLIIRIFTALIVFSLVLSLPILGLKQNEELFEIYSTFVGSKSKYQGVLEVWNIDTFEGGTAKKSNYISKVARSFESKNKGLYILVRDLSEYECINLLNKGEKPDVFSCSYGVACELNSYMTKISNLSGINISENLLNAGKLDGKQFGLPWCMEFYFLISTNSHLKNAGIDTENTAVNLVDIALSSGYEKQTKKGSKITYSISYGTNKYLLPNQAFRSYNNKGLISESKYFFNEEWKNCSQYNAYSNFLANKSVVLLGTNRDVIKMKNRENNGKCEKVYFEPILGFSDLIQFSFLAKNDNNLKMEYAEQFIKFLSLSENQEKLTSFGLFPICKLQNGVKFFDNVLDINLDKIQVNNVFIPKSEIINLQ